MLSARLLWGCALLSLLGCGHEAREPAVEPAHDAAARDAADAWDAGSSDALSIRLSATHTTLCPGQCSTLSLSLEGGRAPYGVRWSDEPSAEQTRELCPTVTTHYEVRAWDSTPVLEFYPPQEVSAALTITVDPTCANVAADAGPPRLQTCSVELPLTAGPAPGEAHVDAPSTHALAVDGEGASYVAAGFRGSLQVGGRALASRAAGPGAGDVVLAKFDAACQHVWSRQLGAPGAELRVAALASNGAGRLAAVGMGQGSLDFGSGPVALSGLWAASWDSQGQLSWLRTFGEGTAHSVVLDEQGQLTFVARGPTALDFGGGPVREDVAAIGFAVVKLDARGAHVFTRGLTLGTYSAWLGLAEGAPCTAGVISVGYDLRQYALRLDALGATLRERQSAPLKKVAPGNPGLDRAGCDALGNVVLSHAVADTFTYRTLQPDLQDRAGGELPPLGVPHDAHALAVMEERFAIARAAPQGVRLVQYDSAGQLLRQEMIAPSEGAWPLGLAFGPMGELVLASVRAARDVPQSIVLERLAPL